jgi:hypothetical protein
MRHRRPLVPNECTCLKVAHPCTRRAVRIPHAALFLAEGVLRQTQNSPK